MLVSLTRGSFLDTNCANFEFGHPRNRIERRIGEQIGASRSRRSETEQTVCPCGWTAVSCAVSDAVPRRVVRPHRSPSLDSVGPRHGRMNLHERFRRSLHQRRDPPGLRARLVLRHDAAGGQIQRKLVVRLFGRQAGTPPDGSARGRRRWQSDPETAAACPDGPSPGHGQKIPSSRRIRS